MNQRVSLLLRFFSLNIVILLLLRFTFFVIFKNSHADFTDDQLLRAFYIGFKFDLRMAAALILPIYFLGFLPFLNPLHGSKIFWKPLYTLFFIFWFLIFIVDFGYFSYLNTRVNGTILQFAANPDLSLQMIFETYPVYFIFFSFLIATILYYKSLSFFVFKPFQFSNVSLRSQFFSHLLFFLIISTSIYGKFSSFPLRWSEAFFSQNPFISALALNPVLYLIDTRKYQRADYDKEKAKTYYTLIADYLGVPEENRNLDNLNFHRKVNLKKTKLSRPNVIIVVMESMAFHKTSLDNNPLDSTPFLKEIANQSYLNTEYYVPSEGTARSMFTLMTAIPDVSTYRTASRNPLVQNQQLISNQLPNYRKYYFLGGNANWGQIRSVFSNNIDGIRIIEEGHYQKKPVDVWGISDLDLFKETFRILNEQEDGNPFFAVIQTAGFHRPYTIPDDRDDFKVEKHPQELIRKASFLNNEEYNSLKFSDYALGTFWKLFKESKYADNTIILIKGDHGLPDQNAPHIPSYRRKLSIEKFRVPLIIYNKTLFPEKIVQNKVVTQMDVMTTLASLMGIEHLNTTFGRDIFNPDYDKKRLAFTIDYYSQPHQYGVFDGEYYLLVRGDKEELYKFEESPEIKILNDYEPKKFSELRDYARGFYETSRYLLYNNPKVSSPQ